MLRQQIFKSTSFVKQQLRLQSTKIPAPAASLKDVGIPDPKNIDQQAPNRIAPWSPNQANRSEVMTGPRFIGKDIEAQPRPYAAIELIHKQPVRFVEGNNIAVCDGNGGMQGHPKVYINLDANKPNTCGYCGLRFARAELKGKIQE